MSGLYKLMNFFLLLASGGLFLLLGQRFTMQNSAFSRPAPKIEFSESSEALPKPNPSPAVQANFADYESVISQNLFAADRKPWEPAPEATPEPDTQASETEVEEIEPLELPANLKLTGVFLLGKTKMAFFEENKAPAIAGNAMQQGRIQQHLANRNAQGDKPQLGQRGNKPVLPAASEPSSEEETKSKTRHGYLEGEEVQGLLVREIRQNEVLLEKAGQQATLPLTQDATLNRKAPVAAANNPQRPGQQRQLTPQRLPNAPDQQRGAARLQDRRQRKAEQADEKGNKRVGRRNGPRNRQDNLDEEDDSFALPDEEFMDDSEDSEEDDSDF